MKCQYCNKELPKIINGSRDVCKCDKAQKEWSIQIKIQHYKKILNTLNKELSELKDKTSHKQSPQKSGDKK